MPVRLMVGLNYMKMKYSYDMSDEGEVGPENPDSGYPSAPGDSK